MKRFGQLQRNYGKENYENWSFTRNVVFKFVSSGPFFFSTEGNSRELRIFRQVPPGLSGRFMRLRRCGMKGKK